MFCKIFKKAKKETVEIVHEIFDANSEKIINEVLERLLPIIAKYIQKLHTNIDDSESSADNEIPLTITNEILMDKMEDIIRIILEKFDAV